MKKLYKVLLFVGLCSLVIFVPKQVHAQTTAAYSANITVDSSIDVLVNGQQTNEDYVANGDTVNVTFNNHAGYQILVCSKGLASQAIANGSSATVPVTINDEAELTVNLTSGNCSNGAGSPGYLYIEGATGSLHCSLVDSKVWDVIGQYSYVPQTVRLYRGSTFVTDIPASTGGGGYYFNTSVNEEFSGQTSAATYYLYGGTSSDELIGQATCPAVQVTTTPSSSTQATTRSSSATIPSSNESATPTSTPTASPQKSTTTTSPKTQEATKPVADNTTKKISDKNTSLYIASGLILFLIAVLLILNFTNIWTTPRKLLLHAWHKARRAKPGSLVDDKPKEPNGP
jgi:hypothetical protein